MSVSIGVVQTLQDLSGQLSLPQEDPRWTTLLQREKSVLGLTLGFVLEEALVPRLLSNNPGTGNVGVLFSLMYSRLRELNQLVVKDADLHGDRAAKLARTVCAGLHLSALLYHALACTLGSREDVDIHCGLGASGVDAAALLSELITALFPKHAGSVPALDDVSFYGANLMLAMLSPQLYTASSITGFSHEQSVVLSVLSSSSTSPELRERLIFNTLSRVLERPVLHKGSLLHAHLVAAHHWRQGVGGHDAPIEGGGGILNTAGQLIWSPIGAAVGLGWGVANFVGLTGNVEEKADTLVLQESPVSDRCLCLLNVLLHNERSTSPQGSPLHTALGICRSTSSRSDGSLEGGSFPTVMRIDLWLFIERLAARLPDAGYTLLLYSMLHNHPAFLQALIGSADKLRLVLVGLLHGVYDESAQGSVEHHYLLSVCVLMLSQQADLRPALVETKAQLPWYRERNFRDASCAVGLADATVLCVLRAMMHVVMRLKDPYLASNYFATLLNLAPFLENVHSYTAERLVGVAHKLARRLSSTQARPKTGDVGSPLMEETLRVLFRAIWLAVKCVGHCINLKYVLARDFLDIEAAFSDPYVVQLCAEVDGGSHSLELVQLSRGYLELVKARESGASAQLALKALHEALPGAQDASLSQVLVYNYEEGDGAAAYFVPFTWETVLQQALDMEWVRDRVTLLTATPAEQRGGQLLLQGEQAQALSQTEAAPAAALIQHNSSEFV
jgi:hypothetical protein